MLRCLERPLCTKPRMTRKDSTETLVELIARCALRDEKAFRALYQATSSTLYAVVLRILKQESWAQEALQDGYLKIWQAAGTYNHARGTPMTWMINIMRNQALDARRRPAYKLVTEEIAEDATGAADDPLGQVERGGELARLLRCMKSLAEKQRACILMIYHQGYTPTEVAARERLPLGTVKTWVRRGLLRVRECLHA